MKIKSSIKVRKIKKDKTKTRIKSLKNKKFNDMQ